MKLCPCCKISKEKKEYYTNKARFDGVDVYCKECKKNKYKLKQQKKVEERLKEQFIKDEIWKDIKNYEGYQASSEGRIRNIKTKNLLKQSKDQDGYGVSSINGKNIKFHRIIAQTFLPNFENKPTVEHKDNNKFNNKLYNLKWATYVEQQLYCKEKQTKKKVHSNVGTKNMKNLEGEVWKVISEYPEYEISSEGRLKYPIRKGLKPYKKRITSGSSNPNSYRTFQVRNDNGKKIIAIHRLVAIEFIPNINNYRIVNHKDGNKKNNTINNLEWCTNSQNTKHAYDNNLISSKKKIYQLDFNNDIIEEWDSIEKASKDLKLQKSCICNVLKERNKTSGGYYWCYKEKYNKQKEHTKYDTNKKKIKQINKETNNLIEIWNSISEAAVSITNKNCSIKATKSNISKCARGLVVSCQGFKWEYE